MDLAKHLLGRGIFPARYAWFLEGRWRSLVLSPGRLAARLPLSPDLTVLEIGAGGGYYSRSLSRSVRRFLAVDIQLAMLQRLRKKSSVVSLIAVRGDATRLPFPSGSVDLTIAVTVLGETPSAETTIAEVRRVLRRGGTFSISEHWPDPDFLRFDLVRTLCEAQGFRLEQRFGSDRNYTANFIASSA
jgi:ubiquinone/menaquinone biosynthesis C-methylase UbiE